MLDKTNFLIPGLSRIAFVRTADLPRLIRLMSHVGIIPTVSAETTDIDFFGEAKLQFSRSKDGTQISTLTFSSSDHIPHADISFIIQNRSGQRMIIGARESPFPMIAINGTSGSAPTDRRAVTYTVTWAGVPAQITVWMDDDNRLPIR